MRIGNYDIVRKIGEGGFAKTYEGRHIYLDEKSCLKQNINVSDEDAALLREEVKKMWDLHHHSLPAMRDYFKLKDGSHIMVMSFIEGKTLEEAVKKHSAIHPEDVCWISQRILQASYFLHAHGIIHGDIKPPNIIVQPSQHNAVLVDFGLSSVRPKSSSKAVGYTPIFAAPEVMDGKPPLPESDLYSLGLTMIYTMGGDPIAKSYPSHVPMPVQEYFNALVRFNPLDRPNWEKHDLVKMLSDVRQEAFGRRHST